MSRMREDEQLRAVLAAGLYLNHIVRLGLVQAGGTNANVAGFFAKAFQVARAEVAHAALNASDELLQNLINRAGDFLERLHTFRGNLARGILLGVPITRSAAGFHRGKAAHASVLLIAFTADLHNFAGRFLTTRQQATHDNRVSKGQRFHQISALGHAAVGNYGNALRLRAFGCNVQRGQLRDADPRNNARGANGSGPLANLDGVGTAIGQVLHAASAGDIAGDDGQLGDCVAN